MTVVYMNNKEMIVYICESWIQVVREESPSGILPPENSIAIGEEGSSGDRRSS